MRISTKGRYAVRAMLALALLGDGRPVNLKSISRHEDISVSYLEQIFVKLRRAGLVKSVRGPGGGYILARPRNEISVSDIMEQAEEELNPTACCATPGEMENCMRQDFCVTFMVWHKLGQNIREFLSSITIEDLCRDAAVIKERVGGKGLPFETSILRS